MKTALAALLGAALTAVACYAAGALLIDRLRAPLRRIERIPLAFTLGAACLHLIAFAILALQIGYWPVLLALLLGLTGWAIRAGAWNLQGLEVQPLPAPVLRLAAIPAGLFSLVYFFNAWAPEHSPDGASYHLGLVARYLRERGLEKITTTIYAMLSEGVEMVFVPAFAIGRHSAAALVEFAFAVALALAILAYGWRLGKPHVGAAAALLTFLSPVVGRTASIAYVDVATAAIVFSAFYWTEIWDEHRDGRLLIPVGLLAGYAYAAKYTAFTIAIYVGLFVLFRAKRLKPVLLVAGCAAVMAGPWIVRNWLWYDNPVAPFANNVFRNPYVHVMFEQDYSAYMRHYGTGGVWNLPREVTVGGAKTAGIIGPVFWLLPLGLLALRQAAGRRIWMAGLLAFAPYFANVGTRFLIPSLPFFSLLIALALARSRLVLGAVVAVHAVASWYQVVPRYADMHAWRIDRIPVRAAFRLIDQDQYLRSVDGRYSVARMIERHVPENDAVLTVNGVADAYTRREIRLSFQSASNEVLADIFNMGWTPGNQPTKVRVFRFPEKRLRRLRLKQIARARHPEQWNIHEMRFYWRGAELPRRPEWRLTGWPMPGYVQMAFDNSPVTRWRSWETASPEMYIDVDFGREESLDEVRIETSPDFAMIRLQLGAVEASGAWERMGEVSEDLDVPPHPQIRRMATHALHARGIHYLMLYDTDFGADDVRADPEAWGLELIDAEAGARLYKDTW
jgi:hypothetical protein